MKSLHKFSLGFAAVALAFAGGVQAASVVPGRIDQVPGGAAAECAAVGYGGYCSYKVLDGMSDEWPDGGANGTYEVSCTIGGVTTVNTIVISNATAKTFDWSSYFGLGKVLVKAGTIINVFAYGGAWSDTQLYAPDNKDISHVTFCWDPDEYGPPPGGEWCSPGYWRQPQHAGAWVATGYTYDSPYTGMTAYSATKRQCAGLPASPTFIQVLMNPQCYGGDAFNAIGDILSGAHPDVDFNGTRTENSCPLGRYPMD